MKMRWNIEIRHHTGWPVLLVEENRLEAANLIKKAWTSPAVFLTLPRSGLRSTRSYVRVPNSQTHMRAATRQRRDLIDSGHIASSRFTAEQLRAIQAGDRKISGFAWHHHQDIGRLQLVPEEIHKAVQTPHIGGFALWYGK